MKLNCDLCGDILTEIDSDHAICNGCGMEYGPERLQELQKVTPPSDPVPPAPVDPVPPVPEANPQQKSGCGIWFLIIMAILDLLVGTHGIVAVFCLLIVWLASRFSQKK